MGWGKAVKYLPLAILYGKKGVRGMKKFLLALRAIPLLIALAESYDAGRDGVKKCAQRDPSVEVIVLIIEELVDIFKKIARKKKLKAMRKSL
jgi:hypothetical protein